MMTSATRVRSFLNKRVGQTKPKSAPRPGSSNTENPAPKTESFQASSNLKPRSFQREPVSISSSQLAGKIDQLAESGGDPFHALDDLGFKGTGSDRVKIGGGTFLSSEVTTTSTDLVYSAHKMVARDPSKTNKQAITQVLEEVGNLKQKNPDMEFATLHDLALKKLLPNKQKSVAKPEPTPSYSAPLTSFEVFDSSLASSPNVGLKQDQKASKAMDSQNLASKINELAGRGYEPSDAIDELGFKGAGSDRISIAGADFQSHEFRAAADHLFIASHKLAGAMPEKDATGIIHETLLTVADLKKKRPDDSMTDLTFDAVTQLRTRQNPKTLMMV